MARQPLVHGARPSVGERVLILKEDWLEKILNGRKSIEIRGVRLREGDVWLGCRGAIHGKARIEEAVPIRCLEDWEALRLQHLVPGDVLPYKTIWGLPLSEVRRLDRVHYEHRRGAIGIVKFRPSHQ